MDEAVEAVEGWWCSWSTERKEETGWWNGQMRGWGVKGSDLS